MTDFGTWKASIANWLARSDVGTGTEVTDITLAAEAMIARTVRTRDQETTSTLTVNAQTVALPTDFLQLRSLTSQTGSGEVLERRTPETLREGPSFKAGGSLVAFAIEGNSVTFNTFDATNPFTVDIIYFARYAAFSADSDTNWLIQNHYDVYLYAGLVQAARLAQDWDAEAQFRGFFQEAVATLEESENLGRFGGSAINQFVRDAV